MIYQLSDCFEVPADLGRTWAFFSDPKNLASITPPWLSFTIIDGADEPIRTGSILNYRIKWMGLGMQWRTRIESCEAPRGFVDVQESGPYALWRHEHRFEPSAGGTVCRDRVSYRLPLGPLGTLAHALWVRRQLTGIFRYRREALAERLGPIRPIQDDVEVRMSTMASA